MAGTRRQRREIILVKRTAHLPAPTRRDGLWLRSGAGATLHMDYSAEIINEARSGKRKARNQALCRLHTDLGLALAPRWLGALPYHARPSGTALRPFIESVHNRAFHRLHGGRRIVTIDGP